MTTTAHDTTGTTQIDHQRTITLLFVGLILTQLMSSLNQTIFSTALPTIVGELQGVEHMSWVITAFILAVTIMMPIYGKVSDLYGRKPLLLAAITIFMIGSLCGALAPSMGALIVARVIQGVGGGGLMILSQAAIADVIPARDRGRYMGIMGGVFAFSSVAGPLLGGWLTEGPGWRWAFWLNIPLGILAFAATATFMRVPRPQLNAPVRLDVLGMGVLAVTTSAAVLAVTWGGNEYAWSSPVVVGLLVTAVLGAVFFAWVESRASEPIMPLFLFRDRNFLLTTIAAIATGVAMFGAIGYMPTYLQMSGGYTASVAGLLMFPMMAALLVTSVSTGVLMSRTGRYKWFPVVGSVLVAIGLVWVSTVTVESSLLVICGAMAVIGMGLGMSMQVLTIIVQNSFPLTVVGTATAATNYFRQVGATLGSAIVGSLFASRLVSTLTQAKSGVGDAPGSGGIDGGVEVSSLTPAVVNTLPDAVADVIRSAYNEALMPIYLSLVPLAVLAAVTLCFVREKPLARSLDDARAIVVGKSDRG
ncbi:MDR family MFS transporter [Jonesia denitrificans]|uniref:Drug resistance transporter, EmrB/QacA subfamily n=1 Tax=Jonesia denitrificans (strain ATCC 14870 / DSM 20603 / BCRC 15368 / CIP 55.134 / JCM 11481 / NBRC 15587 / NCTC 10816 / Prevot 55134) TaxID=471856 RepID=C7QZQ3_JONDD|nr:MDR family MFS transporter [Jonesia denitrificans]ACV08059.1 drug resistance transporter, EmrB/QacA subfamily [Jonesia denitrificans DSM 20603]SQH20037.1 Multidrug-efflux transporter 3 [Jonesia denitrificans]